MTTTLTSSNQLSTSPTPKMLLDDHSSSNEDNTLAGGGKLEISSDPETTSSKDGCQNSGHSECCQYSLTNSLSPTISMESQKSTTAHNLAVVPPVKDDVDDSEDNDDGGALLKFLKNSLLLAPTKAGGNIENRELLFQLGNHLMNLAQSEPKDQVAKVINKDKPNDLNGVDKENGPTVAATMATKMKMSSSAFSRIVERQVAPVLLSAKYRETAFQCSCNEEFENLYIFTIHMKETGHKPKASPAEKDIPKLVRGQDMWINSETEQTKEILRCMHCQQSFRSLPELTMHMIKTNHYSEIVYQQDGNVRNGKLNDSDSVNNHNNNNGNTSGRGSKKNSPDKSSHVNLKRKQTGSDDGQMKKSKLPTSTSKVTSIAKANTKPRSDGEDDSDENPLFSLQRLVNITSEKSTTVNQNGTPSRTTCLTTEPSFFDLFSGPNNHHQHLQQERSVTTSEDPSTTSTTTVTSTPNGLNKKAKCHFCGKPFANKGQVRLHISKNKCPSLMQKNCPASAGLFTSSGNNSNNNTKTRIQNQQSSTVDAKQLTTTVKSNNDLQFTNPHLNAAFNLLQRQFPDTLEEKPIKSHQGIVNKPITSMTNQNYQSSAPPSSSINGTGNTDPSNMAQLFAMMSQQQQQPSESTTTTLQAQTAQFSQQLAMIASLLPLLLANNNTNNPTALNQFNLLSSLIPTQVQQHQHQTNMTNFTPLMISLLPHLVMPSQSQNSNDFNFESCLALARHLNNSTGSTNTTSSDQII